LVLWPGSAACPASVQSHRPTAAWSANGSQCLPVHSSIEKNEPLSLPAFWIGKHEVTIGQYAAFLEALAKTPSNAFDDDNQPSTKTSHVPAGWNDYHAAAKAGGLFNDEVLTLNSPVSGVELLGRGGLRQVERQAPAHRAGMGESRAWLEGQPLPWGNDPRPGAANLGDDYVAKAKGGKIDGHNLWAPVDSMPDDVSECGAVGMAGNVQEWTSTWSPHPELPDTRVPVLRGGHFG